MKLYLFSIYDDKAKAYLAPFFLPTLQVGQRVFRDAVNDPSTNFYKNPGDYTLFCLGTWDQNSAKFELEGAYINVANGLEVKDVVSGEFERKLDAVFNAVFKSKPNGSADVPVSMRDG